MEQHKFKKKYGQNFLYDQNILQKIFTSVNATSEDLIIEIGPGSGNLTNWLQKYKASILAYEIDTSLEEKLNNIKNEKTEIIFDDFLNRNIKDDIKDKKYNKLYVIANIPYYITTPIIEKLAKSNIRIETIILMVQKEVAERLSAKPKTKLYGYITVLLNYFYHIEKLFDVKKSCFYPIPKVDSSIIKLIPHEELNIDYDIFNSLIQNAFKHKRKNLKNNLTNYNLKLIEKVLNKYNYNLQNRAEDIPLDIYVEISKEIEIAK